MRERPILMSAPMVLALLAGRKTQTRRAVKGSMLRVVEERMAGIPFEAVVCPYGLPGDRLWVRETWQLLRDHTGRPGGIAYRADPAEPGLPLPDGKWRPAIYMPRRLSRIDIEIIDVRVQRLHDITEADALAEGCLPHGNLGALSARERYALLWCEINGAGSWDANPWCWALSFKRLRP